MSLFNKPYKKDKELYKEYKNRSKSPNKTWFKKPVAISTTIIKDPSSKQKYHNFLKSDHWKKFRNKIIQKRKSCEICHSYNNLHVHHISYENKYTSKTKILENDVVLICELHHKLFHETYGVSKIMRKEWDEFKKEIKLTKKLELQNQELDTRFNSIVN